MDRQRERREHNATGIFSLWSNWAISTGALALVIAGPIIVSKQWLPFIAFGLSILLIAKIRRDFATQKPTCNFITQICGKSLFWSALCMVVINALHTHWFEPGFIDPSSVNKSIPFVSVLIIAPCTFATTLTFKILGRSTPLCTDCYYRHGSHNERGFLGQLFSQEANYQVNILLWMSGLTSLITWAYYFLFYINVNFNSPDLFFFRWLPILLYALSLGLLGMRSMSLWSYYCQIIENNIARHGNSSLLRYLVVNNDRLLLKEPDPTPADKTEQDLTQTGLDTPALIYVPQRERITDSEAAAQLRQIAGTDEFRLRFLYDSPNFHSDCNIFHFVCFIDTESAVEALTKINGTWHSLAEIQQLDREKRVAPALVAEIARLYTIGSTWKTYDREGRRRYSMKHYRPTFRLSELSDVDVDFNDPQWLTVSNINEDRPFYHLKRFWRKYVSGIGRR